MTEEKEEYQKYIEEMKEFYSRLLSFLENIQENEINYYYLIGKIKSEDHEMNRSELELLLKLLVSIANNHNRGENLIEKIEKIILHLKKDITDTFSNSELYNIFKSNKLILLFLFDNQIVKFDEEICTDISYKIDYDQFYCLYFYPEIKNFLGEERIERITKQLLEIDEDILSDFDEKRHKGENDSYICSLIRQDSVQEFISYVNKTFYQLSSVIKPSLFETNSYLIKNQPTLIEYAAFFGSIEIFQYLRMNKVVLEPSLWYYVIHSNYPEMIHILEENNVEPVHSYQLQTNQYHYIMIESIKCHHNDIANYLRDEKDINMDIYVTASIFNNHDYALFPYEINAENVFFYLCFNGFYTLVDLYLKTKENEIENIIKTDDVHYNFF